MEYRQLIPFSAWILGACLCALNAVPMQAKDHKPIRLGTQDLPPYQMFQDGKITGLAVERVKCALDGLGDPYEIHMISWSQAQLQTQNGDLDGFFVGSKNASRAKYATTSDPVISEDLVWFMAKGGDIDPNDPADALRARFSAKFSTSKWLQIKRNGYNVVKKPRDAESLLNMLMVGDIDVALEYELIFEHYMVERGLEPNYFDRIPLRQQENNVHFSNSFLAANPLFLKRFNSNLSKCRISGS